MRQRHQAIIELRKFNEESKLYGDEFRSMVTEYEQRKKRVKKEPKEGNA